jgi:hypothetical protein
MVIDEWGVGQRIANHRIRRGLSQEELAGVDGHQPVHDEED